MKRGIAGKKKPASGKKKLATKRKTPRNYMG
jgi:hypothetical protein